MVDAVRRVEEWRARVVQSAAEPVVYVECWQREAVIEAAGIVERATVVVIRERRGAACFTPWSAFACIPAKFVALDALSARDAAPPEGEQERERDSNHHLIM